MNNRRNNQVIEYKLQEINEVLNKNKLLKCLMTCLLIIAALFLCYKIGVAVGKFINNMLY